MKLTLKSPIISRKVIYQKLIIVLIILPIKCQRLILRHFFCSWLKRMNECKHFSKGLIASDYMRNIQKSNTLLQKKKSNL